MRPSRSAWPCKILKISSLMVLSFNSDRFILLPPAPPDSDEAASVASDFCGEGRRGLRCEMMFSGGLIVYGVPDGSAQQISHIRVGDVNTKAPPRRAIGLQPHLDDGLAANLRQPFLEACVVLLAIQDVADLIPGLRELLPCQRLLGVQLEEMVPDL